MRDLYKKLTSVTGCIYILFKRKRRENTNKKEAANSQAVPLTTLRNSNPFIFFFFIGSSLPGPNDLFKWRDFYRPRI